MSFMDSIKLCFAKFADFNGRAKRPEFWWFVLFCIIGALVLEIASSYISWAFSLATLSSITVCWRAQVARRQQKRLDAIAMDNSNFRLDLSHLCMRTTRRCGR